MLLTIFNRFYGVTLGYGERVTLRPDIAVVIEVFEYGGLRLSIIELLLKYQ
jgi:hypothetical protein